MVDFSGNGGGGEVLILAVSSSLELELLGDGAAVLGSVMFQLFVFGFTEGEGHAPGPLSVLLPVGLMVFLFRHGVGFCGVLFSGAKSLAPNAFLNAKLIMVTGRFWLSTKSQTCSGWLCRDRFALNPLCGVSGALPKIRKPC